jgi:archaellum component FlaC
MESQSSEVEELRSQVQGLREERAQVRERVEKLLGDVDAMLDQE